jgi:hypothetical protein
VNILDSIKAAFDGKSVPRKNIALRKAHDEIARLQQALDDVVNPLESIRRYAKENGRELASSAWSIANNLHFVQNIAKTARSS